MAVTFGSEDLLANLLRATVIGTFCYKPAFLVKFVTPSSLMLPPSFLKTGVPMIEKELSLEKISGHFGYITAAIEVLLGILEKVVV
jgi:hypothetical protein